jgi:hypothetical protein
VPFAEESLGDQFLDRRRFLADLARQIRDLPEGAHSMSR